MELFFLRFSSRDKVGNNKQLSMKWNSCFDEQEKYLIILSGVRKEQEKKKNSKLFDARSETRARWKNRKKSTRYTKK